MVSTVQWAELTLFYSSEGNYSYRPRITYQYTNVYNYIHFYDSTMSPTQINMISSAVECANKAFKKQCGISVDSKGYPTLKSTLTDACDLGDYMPCSNACTPNHHKDVRWISDQLNNELQSSAERIVFWTDRQHGTYCDHYYGQHNLLEPENPLQGTVVAQVNHETPHVIHFLNLIPDGGDIDLDLACMSITLIHETAHTFGLEEQYNDSDHPQGGGRCVMERYPISGAGMKDFYQDILSNRANAFCPNCTAELNDIFY